MKKIALAAAAIASFAALPAAAVTFTATDGSSTVFANSATGAQFDFQTATTGNTGSPAGFVRTGGEVMSGNVTTVGANPFGAPADNFFLYVMGGGVSTIATTAPGITGYKNISFYMGSMDAGNTVELLGAGGAVLKRYTGTDLAMPVAAEGQQTLAGTNRLLSFAAGTNEVLTGIRFSSSVNSLEADNVRFTAAVPEPATWAMMLVGFGMVGTGMRYRNRKTATKFATA